MEEKKTNKRISDKSEVLVYSLSAFPFSCVYLLHTLTISPQLCSLSSFPVGTNRWSLFVWQMTLSAQSSVFSSSWRQTTSFSSFVLCTTNPIDVWICLYFFYVLDQPIRLQTIYANHLQLHNNCSIHADWLPLFQPVLRQYFVNSWYFSVGWYLGLLAFQKRHLYDLVYDDHLFGRGLDTLRIQEISCSPTYEPCLGGLDEWYDEPAAIDDNSISHSF